MSRYALAPVLSRDISVTSHPSSLRHAESWNVCTSRHECRGTLWPRPVIFLSRLSRLRSSVQNHGMYVYRDMNVALRSCTRSRPVKFLSRLSRLRSSKQNYGMYVHRDMNVAVHSGNRPGSPGYPCVNCSDVKRSTNIVPDRCKRKMYAKLALISIL